MKHQCSKKEHIEISNILKFRAYRVYIEWDTAIQKLQKTGLCVWQSNLL